MAINDTLFDLLNKWKTDILTDNSSVGDTKDYVNQMYALLPMLVNQSLVLSDTVLKREDSWDNVNVNTLHYFEDLGVEGSPDSSMIKRQAGYLIYVKSSVSSLGLQVCITEDLHILYRLAPKGTWIMNANDSAITSLSERLASFETQVNQNGLDALNLRVEALRRQVGAVTGDKIKEISDGLDELSKVISQKVDVYESRQLLTDILNNNDITIYDDGKQLLAPTIAVEGNNKAIAYNISSNNLPSEVKGYQVETSTDKSKWSIHTETVDSGNLLSMINGTKYYVRALALPVDASDRTQSNYSDIVEVTVGTNKTAKTPEKPVPTQYPRTSKTVTPSDVFALASDLKSAVNTINKEKATTGYVDSGLNNLQSKITNTKTAITNALSDVKTQVDNSAVGTNLLLNTSDNNDVDRPVKLPNVNISVSGHLSRTTEYTQLTPLSNASEMYYRFSNPNENNKMYGLEPGQTYTIQGDISVSKGSVRFRSEYHTPNSAWLAYDGSVSDFLVSDSGGFTHISYTFKIPDDAKGIYISWQVYGFDSTTIFRFRRMKLEKGTTATDWCPNPTEIATNDGVQTSISNAISPLQTQVDNSGVGTNLLLKTYEPFSMTGNNTTNQWQQMYSLSRRLEKDTKVTLSFDAVSAAPTKFIIQANGNNGGTWMHYIVDTADTTNKHYVATVTLDGFSDSGINIRFDNIPSTTTITISNMKLELGSNATDYSLNPLDVATDGSVQAINDEIAKKADKTELSNYLKPWMGTQEEYDAISPHDPNTLYMIVEPTTTKAS